MYQTSNWWVRFLIIMDLNQELMMPLSWHMTLILSPISRGGRSCSYAHILFFFFLFNPIEFIPFQVCICLKLLSFPTSSICLKAFPETTWLLFTTFSPQTQSKVPTHIREHLSLVGHLFSVVLMYSSSYSSSSKLSLRSCFEESCKSTKSILLSIFWCQ